MDKKQYRFPYKYLIDLVGWTESIPITKTWSAELDKEIRESIDTSITSDKSLNIKGSLFETRV